jgi:hypothetical protein
VIRIGRLVLRRLQRRGNEIGESLALCQLALVFRNVGMRLYADLGPLWNAVAVDLDEDLETVAGADGFHLCQIGCRGVIERCAPLDRGRAHEHHNGPLGLVGAVFNLRGPRPGWPLTLDRHVPAPAFLRIPDDPEPAQARPRQRVPAASRT